MYYFYSPEISKDQIILKGDDARHAFKVLRKKVGDTIHVTNGAGTMVAAQIQEMDKTSLSANIIQIQQKTRPSPAIHLAVGQLQKTARWEWLLEKAVEIGISRFIPLKTQLSQPSSWKRERLGKIAISAMKQSGQAHLPKIEETQSLSAVFKHEIYDQIFVPTLLRQGNRVFDFKKPIKHILVCIGPEGGFSTDELNLMESYKSTFVYFGENRLRTETAAIYACSVIRQWTIENELDLLDGD